MARIEKTVFISYRRKDMPWALLIYKYLKKKHYDVFLDYTNLAAGSFERSIVSNIKARAHFIVILTPSSLDRCNEPGDWLRREIETAINEKRNIVPLFFDGFSFETPSVSKNLTGDLKELKKYHGLEVPNAFFDAAMEMLRKRYLNVALEAVLHPLSNEVQKIVKEEQKAVDKAISKNGSKWGIAIAVFILIIFGGVYIFRKLPSPKEPTPTQPVQAEEFGIGSTMISEKDGMTMVYVPAGEFEMGSENGDDDEKPAHIVYLDAYWIDQTEVTNAMYLKCLNDKKCDWPQKRESYNQDYYFGSSSFNNYPVIYVSWNQASDYCSWAERRLPTEAEWEKAASWDTNSMGKKNSFPWGNSFDCKKGNFDDEISLTPNVVLGGINCDGFSTTSPVGSFASGASPNGTLDMAGNVWEWVADWYSENYYLYSPSSNPSGSLFGQYRVLRGGSWAVLDLGARTFDRYRKDPLSSYYDVGFRCAMSASE